MTNVLCHPYMELKLENYTIPLNPESSSSFDRGIWIPFLYQQYWLWNKCWVTNIYARMPTDTSERSSLMLKVRFRILFLTTFKLLSLFICLVCYCHIYQKAKRKNVPPKDNHISGLFLFLFFFLFVFFPNFSNSSLTLWVFLSFLWHFLKRYHLCVLPNHLCQHEILAFVANVSQ